MNSAAAELHKRLVAAATNKGQPFLTGNSTHAEANHSDPAYSSIQTSKVVGSNQKHDWARGRPKILRNEQIEIFEKYMISESCGTLSEDRCSGYTINRHVMQVAEEVPSPLDILEKIVAGGSTFHTSGVISIDSTYVPVNLGLKDAKVTRPEVLILGDGIFPHAAYNLAVYSGTPTDAERGAFVERFAHFNKKNGRKIKQVTIDNGVEFQFIRNDFANHFERAEIQISHFHTERYVDKMLPLVHQESEAKTIRQIVRSSLKDGLDTIKDEHELNIMFESLRLSNATVCDEKVQQVLDTLQPLCRNLTTYARLKTGIKSTHQVESINSVIKTRISSMHGFKSFESARLITNALAGYMMFKRFRRNAKYEGRRPVDLCFSPEPRGTWIDYCLKI